jgi:hypothetical protein
MIAGSFAILVIEQQRPKIPIVVSTSAQPILSGELADRVARASASLARLAGCLALTKPKQALATCPTSMLVNVGCVQ